MLLAPLSRVGFHRLFHLMSSRPSTAVLQKPSQESHFILFFPLPSRQVDGRKMLNESPVIFFLVFLFLEMWWKCRSGVCVMREQVENRWQERVGTKHQEEEGQHFPPDYHFSGKSTQCLQFLQSSFFFPQGMRQRQKNALTLCWSSCFL